MVAAAGGGGGGGDGTARDGAITGDSSLTETGAIPGPPAYMAPEQFTGQLADSRSDQFRFCVALYEARYGQRPFSGDNLAALASAVKRGEVREVRGANRVIVS